MRTSIIRVIFLFLLISIKNTSCSDSLSLTRPTTEYMAPGLCASLPLAIGKIIHDFNVAKVKKASCAIGEMHRAILHGPNGNGKNTIAQVIAQQTGSDLITLEAPSIVNSFQNSGAETIKQQFAAIMQKLENGSPGIVLFIDEIDAIASTDTPANHKDTQNALQMLWLEMINHESCPQLLIVCATNKLDKLPKGFLNRFNPSRVIHVGDPDQAQRASLIQGYFTQYKLPVFYPKHLDNLTKKMSTLNPQFYEYIKVHCHTVQELCNSITIELKQLPKQRSDKAVQKVNSLLEKTEFELNQILKRTQTDLLQHTKEMRQTVLEHKAIINEFMNDVRTYLQKKQIILEKTILENIVKETQGLSKRSIKNLALSLAIAVETQHKEIDWKTITSDLLQQTKEHIARENQEKTQTSEASRQKEREELLKELQLRELSQRFYGLNEESMCSLAAKEFLKNNDESSLKVRAAKAINNELFWKEYFDLKYPKKKK